jgi:hypothetical protein
MCALRGTKIISATHRKLGNSGRISWEAVVGDDDNVSVSTWNSAANVFYLIST